MVKNFVVNIYFLTKLNNVFPIFAKYLTPNTFYATRRTDF